MKKEFDEAKRLGFGQGMKSTVKQIDLGNNETISRGINANSNGTFTAMTFTASKTFKTHAGAVRWLSARIAQ